MVRPRSVLFAAAALLWAVAGCTAILGDFSVSASGAGDGGDASPTTEAGGDGGPEAGGDSGADASDAGSIRCDFVTKFQRTLNVDAGSISAERLDVFSTKQSRTVATVRATGGSSIAYDFRFDRPDQQATTVNLAGNLLATGRSHADDATYVLASTNAGGSSITTLYKWPDSSGISASGQTSTIAGSLQAATFGATQQGIFYALAIQGSGAGDGTFVSLQSNAVGPPVFSNNTASTLVDTGLSDGARLYVLSDSSVMLLTFVAANAPQQQLHYPAGSVSSTTSRQISTTQIFPFGFHPNGANVDVAVAVPLPDGTFQLNTATKPEPELFTFNVPGDMKPITSLGTLGGAAAKPCGSFYPGKIAVLLPTNAGFDFAMIEIATGKVTTYLTGAANLLHANASILDCAVSAPQIMGTTTTYDVVWTERVAGAAQNVVYAPLQCAPQ